MANQGGGKGKETGDKGMVRLRIITNGIIDHDWKHSRLSRSPRMAEGDGPSGRGRHRLRCAAHEVLVSLDADATRGELRSFEHRRGERSFLSLRLSQISLGRQWIAARSRERPGLRSASLRAHETHAGCSRSLRI